MKKISLLLLILFGIGLTTSIYASSLSDNPAPKVVAPACNGDIINMAPCDVVVCVYFYDCNQVNQRFCIVVPAGGAVNIPATLAAAGYCCNGILGISTQVLPGGIVSPVIPPGGLPPGGPTIYNSGVPGPCFRLILDYTSGMTYFIRP